MDQELLALATARDVLGHDMDVFCVVKHRMHNLHPNSCPSLVLPRQRYLAVPTRAPTEWEAPTPFKRERADKLLQLATTLEQMTEDWGTYVHTSELQLLCGSWSTDTPVQQWCLGVWAPLPCQLFQHRGTPAKYNLGTCPTCRGAC